jgi:hypothetical protein
MEIKLKIETNLKIEINLKLEKLKIEKLKTEKLKTKNSNSILSRSDPVCLDQKKKVGIMTVIDVQSVNPKIGAAGMVQQVFPTLRFQLRVECGYRSADVGGSGLQTQGPGG